MVASKVLTHVEGESAVRFQLGSTASPPVYETIAHVLDINPPSYDRKTIDTTDLDSNGVMQFLPGLIDPGEVTFTLHFNPSDATQSITPPGLMSLFEDLLTRPCKILWPDESRTTWQFTAFATKLQPAAKFGDAVTANVTFKVSGLINFNAGAWTP